MQGKVVPNAKAITHSETGHVFKIFSDGYNPHEYDEWLLQGSEAILDQGLHVASAGLLELGAVAWIQFEMPENITTAEGVTFRPWFNAFGSLNGKFASTWKTGVTNIVCDNTMRAAQGESGPQFKVKSTANSFQRLDEARQALGIVFSVGEEFEQEVKALCAQDFTNQQFSKLVEQLAPITSETKPAGVRLAAKKRDALVSLWRSDPRVSPWQGTAWGAYQAVNTYGQHLATVRVGNRPERNMTKNLQGKIDESDADVLARIAALI